MVRPRIGIDARLYGVGDRGIGRYTAELIEALQEHRDQFSFTIFIRPNPAVREELHRKGFVVVDAPFATYSVREQLIYPRVIRSAQVDLMHFPHFNVPLTYRGPYVLTIHDLILHHFPSRYASTLPPALYWAKYLGYHVVCSAAISRAAHVVAVSEYTREDVLLHYPQVRGRIRTVRETVPKFTSQDLRNDTISDLVYTQSTPFVLIVGAFYPHKNLERVLRVWQQLPEAPRLVLVGREDQFSKRVQELAKSLGLLQNPNRVHFLGEISDEMLRQLYQQASFLFVPSLFEGAGLPGLEALSLGTPVISSASSSLPEMYGRRAIYLPVESDEQMHASLQRILERPIRHPEPSNETYALHDVAESLTQIYRDILHMNS